MMRTDTDPIQSDWPPLDVPCESAATAAEVSARLARFEVSEIESAWLPFLAAAAAELASVAGIAWRFAPDDPAVALLRLIAKVTMVCPDASGPHAGRLMARLGRPTSSDRSPDRVI